MELPGSPGLHVKSPYVLSHYDDEGNGMSASWNRKVIFSIKGIFKWLIKSFYEHLNALSTVKK